MVKDFTICVGTVGAGVWYSSNGGDNWRRSAQYFSTEYNQPFDTLVEKYCALGTATECVATIERYIEAGVEHINVIPICPPVAVIDQLQQMSAELFSRFPSPASES